ncbi:Hypothetical protein NTJ_04965 [Nesidiocoris tenuis]|nr:Hypothetical protein NTJ_04965 [Nesidiocoris tenuis]
MFVVLLVGALAVTTSGELSIQDWIIGINSQVQGAVSGAIDKVSEIAVEAGSKGKECLTKIETLLQDLEKQKDAALDKIKNTASLAEKEAASRLSKQLERQIARLNAIKEKITKQLGLQ